MPHWSRLVAVFALLLWPIFPVGAAEKLVPIVMQLPGMR
jgi:hypothetical protein